MNPLKLRTGNYTLSYSDVGQGQPLIFLHGFLARASVWHPIISRLSQQYRCISFDLLGFGDSSKPDIPFSIETQRSVLRQFIQALNLREYSLIGHSLGGWIATAYALEYQATGIRRLILLAPAGIRTETFDPRVFLYLPLLIPNPVIDIAVTLSLPLLNMCGLEAEAQHFAKARRYFRERPKASEQALKDFVENNQTSETVDHRLHQLSVPTLVITGAKDSVIPLSQSKTYADKIPLTESLVLDDAGHNLHITHAQPIVENIRHWDIQTKQALVSF